jgi:hypothetical protein
LNDFNFSTSDLWVQVHGLPLDGQNPVNTKKIGRMLSKEIEADLVESSMGMWKRFIRIRVELDVSRPLLIGFPLDRKPLPPLWIPFKYERLGNFCYGCGVLRHDIKNCPDAEIQLKWKNGVTPKIHGSWLRAESSEVQPRIDLVGLVNSEIDEGVAREGANHPPKAVALATCDNQVEPVKDGQPSWEDN